MANKAQARRSKKKNGKYAEQFFRTQRNKLRRAKKREKIAAKRIAKKTAIA